LQTNRGRGKLAASAVETLVGAKALTHLSRTAARNAVTETEKFVAPKAVALRTTPARSTPRLRSIPPAPRRPATRPAKRATSTSLTGGAPS
jgi:hypothetical protein